MSEEVQFDGHLSRVSDQKRNITQVPKTTLTLRNTGQQNSYKTCGHGARSPSCRTFITRGLSCKVNGHSTNQKSTRYYV